jgi:aquaporin Z
VSGLRGGLPWQRWGAEFVGTALLLGLGFSVVALVASPVSPARVDAGVLRFLIIGAAFGVLVCLISLSRIGRVSGAHMNPAVTLAFWLRGEVRRSDLAGYCAAQALGAFVGTACFAVAVGPWASSIGFARTDPSPVGSAGGVAIEAALTFGLVATIFALRSFPRLVRITPGLVGASLTLLIWMGSPPTGASLNPARSLAPAVIGGDLGSLWVYFVGPALGAIAAAAAMNPPVSRSVVRRRIVPA